jgi:hypothetical protein
MQSYIILLAMEYMSVLKEVSKVSQNTKTVCFYPCLNWEHASALSLALSFIPTLLGKVTHKVCCMFKPIEKSLLSDFYYRSAFRNLSRITNVHLFASDWETRQYYSELHIPIKGIHPCYLMPWRQLRLRNSQHPSHRHFLLYMGDAKENKGFTILPSLIRRLVDQFGTNLKLTVQYTLTWENPELQNSIEELQTLARQFEQLNVVNKFWDIRDIVDCIGSVDMFLCTYDVEAYQDKSSGLAWLAAFFNIPVMMLNTCWLTREFERLGVRYGISNILLPKEIPITVPANSDYASSLYADLQSWFVE